MLYFNFVSMLNIQPLSRSKKKKRLDCGQNQIERLAKGDVLHKQSTSKKFETQKLIQLFGSCLLNWVMLAYEQQIANQLPRYYGD